jgi:hypothetical protein
MLNCVIHLLKKADGKSDEKCLATKLSFSSRNRILCFFVRLRQMAPQRNAKRVVMQLLQYRTMQAQVLRAIEINFNDIKSPESRSC